MYLGSRISRGAKLRCATILQYIFREIWLSCVGVELALVWLKSLKLPTYTQITYV